MKGGEVVFEFKGDTKDLEKSATSVGDIIKGSLGAKAISKGIQMINSSLDGAISRVDTLNAYPKVMKQFGVSTDEANKSIKRIDKSVQGLPTSLNQAVAGVQGLFTVTQDLPEAEKMFKAVNDSAMVFANGSTDAVNNFIYAYKQALSAGKVQAQDFNQMNQAIPGLMAKVAEAMGVTQAELKQGLSDGSISMDQFNDALQTLDTQGVGSMSALEEAARTSTGGIKTSFANLKTAIVRGVGNVINQIDASLSKSGLGSISQIIQNLTGVINNAFKGVNSLLGQLDFSKLASSVPILLGVYEVMSKMKPATDGLMGVLSKFSGVLGISSEGLGKFGLALKVLNIGAMVGSFIAGLGTLDDSLNGALSKMITNVASKVPQMINQFVTSIANNMPRIMQAGVNMLIALGNGILKALPSILSAGISIVTQLISGLGQALPQLIPMALKMIIELVIGLLENRGKMLDAANSLIQGLLEGLINGISLLLQAAPQIITSLITSILSPTNLMKMVNGGIQLIKSLIVGIVQIIPQLSMLGLNIVGQLFNSFSRSIKSKGWHGLGIDIMQGLFNGISSMIGKIGNLVNSIASGIKNKFKKALKIGSPSKVFYDYGAYTDEGYMNGLDSMKKKINTELNNMVEMSPQMTQTASQTFRPQTNVNVYNSFKQDPLGQMVNEIKTFSGGAKNDYNYGMGV